MSRGATPIRVRRERGLSFSSQAGAVFHRRKLWRLLACACLAAVLGFTYVWQFIQTNVIGYQLREVQIRNTELRMEIARLRNETAQLAAPARIDGIARRELGMERQGTWNLVMLPAPDLDAPAPLRPPTTFWHVQRDRWDRVGDRLHDSVGPGRAFAATGPDVEADGE